ncbi:thiamine diphosphokinase [Virgibacillus sp. MSJ-26]|uniref:thiamine diphosphokinase n=1 Tax=Virgibacillus sp. MSJ-26 TaxID=2841522 RepID=UPI001C1003B8|nr:thiamine diphosphokinase [Virgibacillus sp. MSJ-26]MBU5467693.1 thiamine diphosphokinase [Virgibacillus sp. MSJ-26]
MKTIGVMANGPEELLPDLSDLKNEIDIWIGADGGALTLMKNNINVDYAVGDFDSITSQEKNMIKKSANHFYQYPSEKDETDLEIALNKAFDLNTEKIYLFGVTGGRLDHTLINIQTLFTIKQRNIQAIIIDRLNKLEITEPGEHDVLYEEKYPNISFIPLTPVVKGITLSGFYYPLIDENLSIGSTLCISNKLLSKKGTFLYEEGILILVKSRDSTVNPIP